VKLPGIFIAAIITMYILILTACAKVDPQTYTIESIEGVKHIHNLAPKWDDEPRIKLEFVQKIGDIESDDENYMLFRPVDCDVDKKGNIYILEIGSQRIQKFNSTGKYLSTFGRKGQGPGEFRLPSDMCLWNDSLLYVYDGGRLNIQLFTIHGEVTGGFNTTGPCNGLEVLSTGEIVTNHNYYKDTGNPKSIALINQNGEVTSRFGTFFDNKDKIIRDVTNNHTFAIDSEDNIYTAFNEANRIEKYSNEYELQFSFDQPLNYEVEHSNQQGPEGVRLSITNVSGGIDIDPLNRIWILTFKKQITGRMKRDNDINGLFEFTIFDENGILLGKRPLPVSGFRFKIVRENLFIIDTMNEMCVYQYKIIDLEE
jgi:hypothetical protein